MILQKFAERILYGFGFGIGMGVSLRLLKKTSDTVDDKRYQ